MSRRADAPALRRALELERVAVFAAALVASAGVLSAGWPPVTVLALFWTENVVIGAFQALRILIVGLREGLAALFGTAPLVLLFVAHYGLFCLAHAALIVGFLDDADAAGLHGMPEAAMLLFAQLRADHTAWLLVGVMTALAGLDTLRWIFASRIDENLQDIGQLMKAPYARLLVLHVTLLLGGFVLTFFDAPSVLLLLLVGLKLAFDLRHIRQAAAQP